MLFGGISLHGHPDPENIRRLDTAIVRQIGLMTRKGIAIDIPLLNELSLSLAAKMVDLRKDIVEYIPPDKLDSFTADSFNVESSTQIGQLLFEYLGIGRGRRLKMTKAGDRISTGKKQLETIKQDHPVIPLILKYRECSKLKNTYTDALPNKAKIHNRGECRVCGYTHLEDHPRIHTTILTTRTDTGRLASKSPNLQNVSARSELGREVRKAFVAEKGKRLVGYDYAGIELRLLAHLANERKMISIFKEDGDIHLTTAMGAFGITDPTKVDKNLHRAPSKTTNFLIVYQGSAMALVETLTVNFAIASLACPDWLTLDWCEDFMDKWHNLYPDVKPYMELQNYRARRYGITWCMFGGVRRIPEVRSVHERVVQAGLRQAGNNPIQRGAAGVFKLGMIRTQAMFDRLEADHGIRVDPLLPIHDELIVEVDEEWAEEVGVWQGHEMAEALRDMESGEYCCRVPIGVDGKTSERWEK